MKTMQVFPTAYMSDSRSSPGRTVVTSLPTIPLWMALAAAGRYATANGKKPKIHNKQGRKHSRARVKDRQRTRTPLGPAADQSRIQSRI